MRSYPMGPAFADQEQGGMLHVRAITPPHRIQALLEILRARRSNISTA